MKSLADMDQTALKFEIVKLSGGYIAKFELISGIDKLNQEQALEQIIRALK